MSFTLTKCIYLRKQNWSWQVEEAGFSVSTRTLILWTKSFVNSKRYRTKVVNLKGLGDIARSHPQVRAIILLTNLGFVNVFNTLAYFPRFYYFLFFFFSPRFPSPSWKKKFLSCLDNSIILSNIKIEYAFRSNLS